MRNSTPPRVDTREGWALREMRDADLDQVVAIERSSFSSPWQRRHFLHELHANAWALNWVVERAARIVAYTSVWCIGEELKINNLAVHPGSRKRGLGSWLLGVLIEEAGRRGCRVATLEVRPSNRAARVLYRKHRFREVGRRKNYYAVEGEDAIVMERRIDPRAGPGAPG